MADGDVSADDGLPLARDLVKRRLGLAALVLERLLLHRDGALGFLQRGFRRLDRYSPRHRPPPCSRGCDPRAARSPARRSESRAGAPGTRLFVLTSIVWSRNFERRALRRRGPCRACAVRSRSASCGSARGERRLRAAELCVERGQTLRRLGHQSACFPSGDIEPLECNQVVEILRHPNKKGPAAAEPQWDREQSRCRARGVACMQTRYHTHPACPLHAQAAGAGPGRHIPGSGLGTTAESCGSRNPACQMPSPATAHRPGLDIPLSSRRIVLGNRGHQ